MTVFFIIVICIIIEVFKAFKEATKPVKHFDMNFSWDGKPKPWDDAIREKDGK